MIWDMWCDVTLKQRLVEAAAFCGVERASRQLSVGYNGSFSITFLGHCGQWSLGRLHVYGLVSQ